MLSFFDKEVPSENLTVSSVYEKFTQDLQTVVEQQQQVVNDAKTEQDILQAQLLQAEQQEAAASKEIDMATTGITNIGKLLGLAS